jgi:xanthine dehydrogenase accessory factor
MSFMYHFIRIAFPIFKSQQGLLLLINLSIIAGKRIACKSEYPDPVRIMKNIYLQIIDKQSDNSPLVMATITGTIGSTPAKPGTSALFGKDGLLSGTVGGGIMEAKVQNIAQSAIASKESGYYHFQLDNDINQKEEAICGGQANILIDAALNEQWHVFEQIKQSLLQSLSGVLVSKVTSLGDCQVSIQRSWITRNVMPDMPSDPLQVIEPMIKSMLSDDNSGNYRELSLPDGQQEVRYFLERIVPFPKLVIVGAGHIGKALSHLGSLLDFDVTVIDDRPEYANAENIPDADQIVVDDIRKAMQAVTKTPDTYIVIVTRGHKNDADALKSCIGSDATFVGMIGSSKKVAMMRRHFMEEGLSTPTQWESVYAPIGLDIHSQTVQEIAVSIAAQLIQVRNHKVSAHA